MTIADILVHVDDRPSAETRMALALTLARRHGAHLAALYLFGAPPLPGYVAAELPASVLDGMREAAFERARAAESRMRRLADAAGIALEWRPVEAVDPGPAVLHGRYADLNIVGQDDPDQSTPYDGLVEEVVLGSGRPVLAVPYAGRFDDVGSNVLIAWNASREAARAVHDVLPLVQPKARINVLAVDPNRTEAGGGAMPGADIATHLARRGLAVEASQFVTESISVGDLLLSRAADLSADLIVMGAYGHSRVREVVLGGVTRHLLAHMTVPVLMSH
ncbi:MAG: universal stress protein [Alphaproteobacteria bacterium]|nr:universal stress protein [Alphaproteobacteria bacterium]